ncbi:MAG: EF-hand domain-containing protein [Rhodospirillales bacterium]
MHFGRRYPLALCLGVAIAAWATACALAQQGKGDPDDPMDLGPAFQKVAFDAADTDGDGLVSEAEFVRDAAAAFAGLDENRDRKLSPAELGPHDPQQFKKVDANGDGVLTFKEVMTLKMKAFNAGDKSGDGKLSYEEMVESVKAE